MTVVEGIRRLGESLFLEVEMSTMGSCREPAWGTPPVAKVMRKEASAYAKAGSSLRKPPIPEHLPPKSASACFTALCSLLHLCLYGGLPPTTSLREGVNLQLQSIKIAGVTRVFQLTNSSEGSLACLNRFVWPHVVIHSLPTVRGTICFKLSKYRFFWEVRKSLV